MSSPEFTDSMRHPRPLHMNRRACWLVILNLFIPGIGQMVAGNRFLARVGLTATFVMWVYFLILLVQVLFSHQTLMMFFTSPVFLYFSQWLFWIYALLWIILTLDSLRLVKMVSLTKAVRIFVAFVSVLTVFVAAVLFYAANMMSSTASTLQNIFVSNLPMEPPVNGRYNIMLLGGDAGPDREGMRPDSLSVVSIDADSGQRVSIGLPRDLSYVPFRAGSPMAAVYPKGFPPQGCEVSACQLNTIYVEAQIYRSALWPNVAAQNSTAGFEATKDAIEGATGLQINYYVFINMNAFSELVNALGGVEVEVAHRVPIGGDEDLRDVAEWIEPGKQKMNGYRALWYARSRHGSSDYDRMARQRQIQEALLQQFSPGVIIGKFQELAKVAPELIKTNIPQSMLPYFINLLDKGRSLPAKRLELVPPQVDPEEPDYQEIHALVAQALENKH